MREQFVDTYMAQLVGKISDEDLEIVARELRKHLNNYDVQQRCTELVPIGYANQCEKVYLVTRKIEGLSQGTIVQYKLRLDQFFDVVRIPIEKITANDVRVYLYQYQEQTGCSDRTLDGIRGIISTFFAWAAAEDYIPKNPCATIKAIKYTEKQRGHLSDMEIEMLRNACDNIRDKAILETLYSTGCRVSELINLKINDIDFRNSEVTLFGKGKKYRKSYINAKAEYAIRKYLETRDDSSEYLFVSRRAPHEKISKRTVETLIKKLGERAGIAQDVYPHLIRHTTATLGLQRGMDITNVQKMLGHKKIDTTLIYAEVADTTVKNNHRRYIV